MIAKAFVTYSLSDQITYLDSLLRQNQASVKYASYLNQPTSSNDFDALENIIVCHEKKHPEIVDELELAYKRSFSSYYKINGTPESNNHGTHIDDILKGTYHKTYHDRLNATIEYVSHIDTPLDGSELSDLRLATKRLERNPYLKRKIRHDPSLKALYEQTDALLNDTYESHMAHHLRSSRVKRGGLKLTSILSSLGSFLCFAYVLL